MYTDPGSSIYTKTDAYFLQTYLAKSITIWAFFTEARVMAMMEAQARRNHKKKRESV